MPAFKVHPLDHALLLPVGYRRDGRPIWPILGAEDGGEGGQEGAGGASDGGQGGSQGGAGNGGSEAEGDDAGKLKDTLTKVRAELRDAQKAAKSAKDLQAELDKLKADQQTDTEKAIEKARAEAAAETRAEMTRERVLDKIEVAAAGKFADVEDARLHLGQHADEYIAADGSVDTTAISKAVTDLLEAKPHLKAAAPQTRRTSHDGGVRTDDGKPSVAAGAQRYAALKTN